MQIKKIVKNNKQSKGNWEKAEKMRDELSNN
mgnify:CR=1 FL=1